MVPAGSLDLTRARLSSRFPAGPTGNTGVLSFEAFAGGAMMLAIALI
jgi:hypothetical protein